MIYALIEIVSMAIGFFIWNCFLSNKIKINDKFNEGIICFFYYFLFIYGPFLIKFLKNNYNFHDKKIIADIFLLTSVLISMVLIDLSNVICLYIIRNALQYFCVTDIIYCYIRGMYEHSNGAIFILIISLIIRYSKNRKTKNNMDDT